MPDKFSNSTNLYSVHTLRRVKTVEIRHLIKQSLVSTLTSQQSCWITQLSPSDNSTGNQISPNDVPVFSSANCFTETELISVHEVLDSYIHHPVLQQAVLNTTLYGNYYLTIGPRQVIRPTKKFTCVHRKTTLYMDSKNFNN